ncbi:hypothetical protein EUTSA_v10010416mg [Eutrema salsugineum]|uniref:FBD domain-containing protein n=1 Tax=Eutrema salsugineum TaxID=72664 RepID=V4LMG5_EUTSA|nr:FBD-associated F-box protein At4g10400 [Eutrema salsugineum]ESQ44969.1 hypothetical protein EUTSA_v10010416mg [Eutrema salsugineum]
MDRISGLSDELLIKILLFVPTKVAVSTSILSKRWEYLWMWLPKLDYGPNHFSRSDCKRLRCFLDRNLPLHRAPVIESFRFKLYGSYIRPESIKLWVVLAISHCLRELEIIYESNRDKQTILPSNLYSCKSLVILKLDGTILLDVPRTVFLPSLKTLQLQDVKYFNDESIQRLLSNCPVLEALSVSLREEESMEELTIVSPSLQSLSIYIPHDLDILGIEIKTPSLTYLKLDDQNQDNLYCFIEEMPNLIEAYVDFNFTDIKSLIGSITSVKRLAICSQAMYDESFVFTQLEHLELCTCKEVSPDLLVRLLKDSSNLQGLDLFCIESHSFGNMVNWNKPSTVPKCILSSLQTFNFLEYIGAPKERDLVVYILQNALHLKTAAITSCKYDVPRFEMLKELALSSRASATCQLMFD